VSSLRVAIVGCGKIADQHLWAVERTGFAKVVAVCDREELMAEQLAERSGIPYRSADLRSLLVDARPDVVHITTPPQSHYPLAAQCLDAGCHVYVEKPFTTDTDEAIRLVNHAQAVKRSITVGHNLQFTWESLDAREHVRNGWLGGPPIHIESYFTYALSDASYARSVLGDKRHWVRHLRGKLLHNIISHGIARIAEYVDVEQPRIAAFGYASPLMTSIGEADVLDELRVLIAGGTNMTASFAFSSQFSPPSNGCRLYGRAGGLTVDNTHHTLVRHANKSYKSFLNYFVPPVSTAREYVRSSRRNVRRFLKSQFHDDSGLGHLVAAFYRAILGEAPLPISYREIVLTSRIMDTVFDQLRSGASSDPAPTPISRPFELLQAPDRLLPAASVGPFLHR
jgi:predicted dehydrogenase